MTEAAAFAKASLACATTSGGRLSGLVVVVDSVVVAEFEFAGACVACLASPTGGRAEAGVCSLGNSALGSSLDATGSSFFVSTTTTLGALSTVGVDWIDNGSC